MMRKIITILLAGCGFAIAACSSGVEEPALASQPTAAAVGQGNGIVTRPSKSSVAETTARLEQAATAKGLKIVAKVDHAANAVGAGLDLGPAMVLFVGNPQAGTPLMQSSMSFALDLPQRIAVYEITPGQVRVSYNDPAWLAARHGVTDQADNINKTSETLGNIVAAATR